MDIRISGDAVEGYTLENAYRYDSMELRYLLSWLPKAIKATRKELNRRAVEKRCREIESKTRISWRDALWYALHSGRIGSTAAEACDNDLEWYEIQHQNGRKWEHDSR